MENGYVIATDSTTDMSRHYYEENNIAYIGMHYTMDGTEYIQYSDEELPVKEFYSKVREGSLPKTSQVAYDDLVNLFQSIIDDNKDVFYLCFSSALSGSYQTALLAANDLTEKNPGRKIVVVDSVSASGGEGLLLNLCVAKRDKGVTLEELTEYAENIKHNVVHLFTVDDLNHLHRGGRVSKLSAVVGGMLGIKPILYVSDTGHLLPYAKIRGRKQSLEAMAKQMKEKYTPGQNEEIYICDGDAREDAEYLGNLIMKMMPDVKKVRYDSVGAVIGTHSGPGTVALFFIGKERIPVEIK